MTMNRDSELLRTFHEKRSEPAFRALVDRHIDWLYSVALRQVGGDAHLAEDVCQEVFASVARKAETLMEFEALNGWLFKAARFAASDLVRRERRRRNNEEEACAMNELSSNDKAALDWEAAGEFLGEAIEELGERDRDALCLRFFENRKFAQIGEELGVTENGARMRVGRALDKLSGILGRRGIRSSSAALAVAIASHPLVSAPPGLALAAANGAVGSGAAGAGMFGGFKFGYSLACGAAVLAVGVAVHQGVKNQGLEERATRYERAVEQANARLAELETLSGEQRALAPASDAGFAASEGISERAHTVDDKPALDVMERLKRAEEWKEAGRLEEALAEYLWLFENGVKERRSFSGLRMSSVLDSIVEIADSIPRARRVLEQKRMRWSCRF